MRRAAVLRPTCFLRATPLRRAAPHAASLSRARAHTAAHARAARPAQEGRSDGSLVLQAALVVAALGCALALFAAHPASPYAALPEVIFARKLAVGLFWKARAQRARPNHPTQTQTALLRP
jgi:hypothetical protein